MKFYKHLISTIFFGTSLILFADYEVQTSSGIVDGFKKNRVIYWEDIPYALPPIGELRWKAPRDFINRGNSIQKKDNNYCVQRPSTLGGPGGEGAMVGAGALVTPGTIIAPGTLWTGVPAKYRRDLRPEESAHLAGSASHYCNLAGTYLSDGVGRVPKRVEESES